MGVLVLLIPRIAVLGFVFHAALQSQLLLVYKLASEDQGSPSWSS